MLVGIALMVWSTVAFAALYIWQDEMGGHHMTDQLDKLPPKYFQLLNKEKQAPEDSQGVGYWIDETGNYHFYDKRGIALSSPDTQTAKASSSPLTGKHAKWKGNPNPFVHKDKVKDIISGDTILLASGQKLKYIGIEFPESHKGDSELHKECREYQSKMLKGKSVAILFDKNRYDDKGRLLGFVYIGTDKFVNADLVLTGYAQVKTVPPNLEYRDLFIRLEKFARENQFGIWKETD
jgi:micrococcal nuclease